MENKLDQLQSITLNNSIARSAIEQTEQAKEDVQGKVADLRDFSRIANVTVPAGLAEFAVGEDPEFGLIDKYIDLLKKLRISKADVQSIEKTALNAANGIPPTAVQIKKITKVTNKLREISDRLDLEKIPNNQMDEYYHTREEVIPAVQKFLDFLPDLYRSNTTLRKDLDENELISYDDSNRDVLSGIKSEVKLMRDAFEKNMAGSSGGLPVKTGIIDPPGPPPQPPQTPPPSGPPSAPPPPAPPKQTKSGRPVVKPARFLDEIVKGRRLTPVKDRKLAPPKQKSQKEQLDDELFKKIKGRRANQDDDDDGDADDGKGKQKGKGFQKISQDGIFGSLKIDMNKFFKMKLVARKNNRIVIKGDLSHDLFLLLTKRYNPKHQYSQTACDEFKKIVELADLPSALAKCGKGMILKNIVKGKAAPPPTTIETKFVYYDTLEELLERLHVIIGSIEAGNNNSELKEEGRQLLERLKSKKAISNVQFESLLQRL